MVNTLRARPLFTLHRAKEGSPVAADSTDLDALYADAGRGSIDCTGWKTVRAYVRVTGAGGTVTFQPLEKVVAGDEDPAFAALTSNVGPQADGSMFDLTVNGAVIFLRIHATTNSPTAVEVYLAGAEAQPSLPGDGR